MKTLFLDIGGVLLTNGWDRQARQRAVERFGLDPEEMDERHHLVFAVLEIGHMTLDEYLQRVVFYTRREFSVEEFRQFMFSQSKPLPEAIDLMRRLKRENSLKVAALSNESRELTLYRIREFGLASLCDFFVSSCFVGLRKPDGNMFRLALDLAGAEAREAVYIDDRPPFVEAAISLGFQGIVHRSAAETRRQLAELGVGAADAA